MLCIYRKRFAFHQYQCDSMLVLKISIMLFVIGFNNGIITENIFMSVRPILVQTKVHFSSPEPSAHKVSL